MKKWVFALCVGLALLAFGSGAGKDGDTIKCGSETMYPGSVCEETRAGSTVDTKTYEEMRESKEAGQRIFNSWGRWALLGGGSVLTIAGIFGIVATRRRRKAAAGIQQPHPAGPVYPPGQPNAPHVPPQGGHYGQPQQYHPPQGFGPTGPREG
jgi:hypothetical protein